MNGMGRVLLLKCGLWPSRNDHFLLENVEAPQMGGAGWWLPLKGIHAAPQGVLTKHFPREDFMRAYIVLLDTCSFKIIFCRGDDKRARGYVCFCSGP